MATQQEVDDFLKNIAEEDERNLFLNDVETAVNKPTFLEDREAFLAQQEEDETIKAFLEQTVRDEGKIADTAKKLQEDIGLRFQQGFLTESIQEKLLRKAIKQKLPEVTDEDIVIESPEDDSGDRDWETQANVFL